MGGRGNNQKSNVFSHFYNGGLGGLWLILRIFATHKNNIMKQFLLLSAIGCLLGGCATEKGEDTAPLKMIDAVDFSHVKIEDAFWSPRLEKHITTTLPVCIDQIENQTGRIRNFENAAKGEGEHSGIFFDDSDVYKALEGMAYTLINPPDPEL